MSLSRDFFFPSSRGGFPLSLRCAKGDEDREDLDLSRPWQFPSGFPDYFSPINALSWVIIQMRAAVAWLKGKRLSDWFFRTMKDRTEIEKGNKVELYIIAVQNDDCNLTRQLYNYLFFVSLSARANAS